MAARKTAAQLEREIAQAIAKRPKSRGLLSRARLDAIYEAADDDPHGAVVREFDKHKVAEIQAWLLAELSAKGWRDEFEDDIRKHARDKAGLIEWASNEVFDPIPVRSS